MRLIKASAIKYESPTGILGKDWNVFDDGVLVNSNVEKHDDGSFSLLRTPVGEVRILVME